MSNIEDQKAAVVDGIITDVAEITAMTAQLGDLTNPENSTPSAQGRAEDAIVALQTSVNSLDASVRASAEQIAAAQENLARRRAYLESLRAQIGR